MICLKFNGVTWIIWRRAAVRRSVLEITGDDVADFVEELLKNTRTYPTDWKSEFNHEIQKSLK